MGKPHLSDFNLTEDSLKAQQQQRGKWKFVMFLLSLLVLIADYGFWVWASNVIGHWSLLGLFLTFWGIIPAVVAYTFLDSYLGKQFYDGLNRYKNAKKQYDQ
jgi:hypothetical protein